MYHAIVKAKIAHLFAELNKGNYEPVLDTAAREFEHWFAGNHALSGRRTSLAITRMWYERLFKILPGLRFDIHHILVRGWPWDTLVAVEWSDTFTLHDGAQRSNRGVHLIRLRWGRGASVRIYCDTDLLMQNLALQRDGGVVEAGMPPLVG